VTPHVDRFVPLAPEERDLGRAFTTALGEGALDSTDLLTADIHLFYGGLARLRALIEKLPRRGRSSTRATRRARRSRPCARSRAGSRSCRAPSSQAIRTCCTTSRTSSAPCSSAPEASPRRPATSPEATSLPSFRCPLRRPCSIASALSARSYVACQIASNNPKKDWPVTSWRQLIGARARRPDSSSSAGPPTASVPRASGRRNVVDLCGRTSLEESGALIAQASAFVGIDSGMAHVAVNVGVPTVVIAQNSTLGWFFPYPPELARPNLLTLHNPRSPECIGCFFACPREPLWEMVRRGARCLRELAWQEVDRAWAESAGAAALDRNRA
jgi:hypothetical protein